MAFEVSESYAAALAFSCFTDAVISISSLTKMPDGKGVLDRLVSFVRNSTNRRSHAAPGRGNDG